MQIFFYEIEDNKRSGEYLGKHDSFFFGVTLLYPTEKSGKSRIFGFKIPGGSIFQPIISSIIINLLFNLKVSNKHNFLTLCIQKNSKKKFVWPYIKDRIRSIQIKFIWFEKWHF